MAHIFIPKRWRRIPEREATPEQVYWNRRKFLAAAGATAAFELLPWPLKGAAEPLAQRNQKYKLERPVTAEESVTSYNNFIEFSDQKDAVGQLASGFKTDPWTITVFGLVGKPQTLDVKQLIRKMPMEERLYRHRCVEGWAMAVPWTGFPLAELIKSVQPKASARFVRFRSFYRPDEAPGQRKLTSYPWPFNDSLTLAEATNELAFLVTGMYGHELAIQNGAPMRLVAPWKYGFKSVKSIVGIEFLESLPTKNLTYWHDVVSHEHDFSANVDPEEVHPRWSQKTEKVLGTWQVRPTQLYNGYGEFVAHLYAKR
ncbi:MAG: mononuclear molybdenum enzyme YedY [Acidobacteria bacterium RIFCSPLOWO2_12_FULL_54_10]|nr:MAG: mononuclear molybdenum enzyme YedY [Acidobacteria bacterium RIFCSPLOWO2_12_FULL_54_10]